MLETGLLICLIFALATICIRYLIRFGIDQWFDSKLKCLRDMTTERSREDELER